MSSSSSILVYGRDQRLLETRSWVLEQAGFHVQTAMALGEAEQVMGNEPVEVVVLCHTLSSSERVEALAAARRLRPGVQRMVMTADALTLPEDGQEETLSVYDGPRQLIRSVQQLAMRYAAPR